MQFPIKSEHDITHARWIVAVCLMESQTSLAVYRCPNEPAKPGFKQNGSTFRHAVARCRDHIKKNILPQFLSNQHVTDVINALNHLVEELTGSGMPEGALGCAPASNIPDLRLIVGSFAQTSMAMHHSQSQTRSGWSQFCFPQWQLLYMARVRWCNIYRM